MGLNDIGVTYTITYAPDPLSITMKVCADENKVKAIINSVGDFSIDISPGSGPGVTDDMLSAVLLPLARILSGKIKDKISGAVAAVETDLYTVPDMLLNAEGTTIKMHQDTVTFSNFNGMLMVAGTFTIS